MNAHKGALSIASRGIAACVFGLAVLALPGCAPAPQPAPPVAAAAAPPQAIPQVDLATARIVLVEWRIKRGREQDFLKYWSTRATIADRSGLIGEFLSRVDDPRRFPWMVWGLDQRWTTFVNVGLWRSSSEFEKQIGQFIDLSRPPLEFEAEGRRRVMVVPERWRIGHLPFITTDHPEVH